MWVMFGYGVRPLGLHSSYCYRRGILTHMNDITSLQQTFTDTLTSNVTSNVQSELEKIMAWVLIPSIILTLAILVVYIAHVVHRHRVDKAIFEIRDTLREMKLGQVPVAPTPAPSEPQAPPAPSVAAITPPDQGDVHANQN